jgi:lipopolysaccharide/colanic/teichoic acid biosynthesis glycosyltransferase
VSFYRRYGKRALDITGAAFLLAATAPLLTIAAIAVRYRLGAPVLYRQVRPGAGGRPFTLLKLRSMADLRAADGEPLPDAERLTRFGSFLRQSSVDELPELWNVLRGDMSLVGPRPLLTDYLELYSPQQARRHEVRPGITGLAQVNGRNTLGWEEKFALDVRYVDNCSFGLDVRILARTVWSVLARHGISEAGQATAQRFRGSPS